MGMQGTHAAWWRLRHRGRTKAEATSHLHWQNGCLTERLAAGHWAKETVGSAAGGRGGVRFAYYYIPTPRQKTFIF